VRLPDFTSGALPGAALPPVAPVLDADGLVLRPWDPGDVGGVLAMADDDESRRWSPSLRAVRTATDAWEWIARRLERRTDWAAVDPATGRLAGRVGLHHHDPQDRSAELGYGVAPGFRRAGVARRVVTAAVGYGFAEPVGGGLGLYRVHLRHAVGNVGSCRTALACGFPYEGLSRGVIDDGSGGFDDVHVHGRLVGDPPGPVRRLVPSEPVEIVAGAYQLCVPDPARDAEEVLAACADPEIRQWNPGPTTLDEARAWVARRADWALGDHASWLVRAASGELVGSVSLHEVDEANSSCEVGYWVAAPARGRGVAAAAISAAARFAFGAVGLARVELFHAVDNPASCGAALRAGFALEGTHRLAYRYGDGRLHDDHSHARLATDPDPG
jgi:RimJ/RimL family protein N-acetyltransferase